jgi:general stress protein 26
MDDLKQRVLGIIRRPFLAGLATVTEDGNPWVRYVMPVASEDMTLRFSTFVTSRKTAQIKNNPEVHLVCGVTNPVKWKNYLQIQGHAEITTDQVEKDAFWNETIAEIFKGPDDPNYAVVIVRPYRVELYSVGTFEPEVWEA